jgi:type I restriction enzyme S subunit
MIYDQEKLPQGWQWVKLKFISSYNDETLAEDTDPDYEFCYIEISDVSLAAGVSNSTKLTFAVAPSRARRIVRAGDILVSTVRTYLKAIANVSGDASDLIASTGFCVVRPKPAIDARYLGWALKSDVFVDEVVSQSVGVSYPAINPSTLVDIKIPVPPPEQQIRISEFLSEKTYRLDKLARNIFSSGGASSDALSNLQYKLSLYRSSLLYHEYWVKLGFCYEPRCKHVFPAS